MLEHPYKSVCIGNGSIGQHAFFLMHSNQKVRPSTVYALEKKGVLVKRNNESTPWYRADYYLIEEVIKETKQWTIKYTMRGERLITRGLP